jgi:RNA polymerase sigma-70 factor (sigma-E family)
MAPSGIGRSGILPASVVHGSRSSLGELYVAYADSAKRLAYLLTGDKDLAEDITQDAFVKLAGRLGGLRDPYAFDSYLRRTVVNLSRSHFRRLRVERMFLRRAELTGKPETADTSDVVEADALWSEVQRLPYRQRCAIVLRYYEDLSERQSAEALDCSVGAVKALTNRAMEHLRKRVGSGSRT